MKPKNSYTRISNDLIIDRSISIECRWLIIFCLSKGKEYEINPSNIRQSQAIGKNRLYKLINEAINAGYFRREECLNEQGLKRSRTRIAIERQELPQNGKISARETKYTPEQR